METKCDHVRLEWIRVKLGFCGKLVVDCDGKKGGLCLLWDKSIDVSLLSYSRFHIDVHVSIPRGVSWRFTGMYGHPDSGQRQHSWNLLRRLHGMSSLPWLCVGDFNVVLESSEKEGGVPKSALAMSEFRSALDECGLQDLGFFGPKSVHLLD